MPKTGCAPNCWNWAWAPTGRSRARGQSDRALAVWFQGEKAKKKIGDSTIEYKMELLNQVCTTWRNWDKFELDELSEANFVAWVATHRAKYSATRTNGAMTVLRDMLAIAVRDKFLLRPFVDETLHGLVFVPVETGEFPQISFDHENEDLVVEIKGTEWLNTEAHKRLASLT